MNPTVNILLKEGNTGRLLRVVDLDFEIGQAQMFECKSILSKCQMPFSMPMTELNSKMRDKTFILTEDKFIKRVEEKDICEKDKNIRDRAYLIVEELVGERDIFSPVHRNILIKKARKKYGVSKPTLYKFLKKYFRNGLNQNALLPDFKNCGAPNKERKSGVPDDVRKIIIKGFGEFVVDLEYKIRTAYDETITKYYKKEIHGRKFKFHTFYYHGRRAFPDEILKRSKKTEKAFDANDRLLSGRSNDIVNGPCRLYQIDSTQRDIRIVSSLNPNQEIGRPTFYVVIDAWSRAIVGILITLDNPSYIAAAQALFISFRSKELLIKELGLGPEFLGWSNSFTCDELVADRAELLGPKSDQIAHNFEIRLGNTAAYRPDLKGVVEKIIDIIQERVLDYFRGKGQVMKDDGHRLAKDTSLEACITLEKLYQISWVVANEYNNHHWIDDYPLTAEMVRDSVRKIPAALHKWGIEHNLGKERTSDEKTLWLNLMEPGKGKLVKPEKLSRKPRKAGIRFNKQDYVPVDDRGFKIMQNLICAPNVAPVKIVYDPRMYKNIYWLHQGEFVRLRLRGKDDVQYSNVWEINSSNKSYAEMRNEALDAEQDERIKSNLFIKGLVNCEPVKRKTAKNSRAARSLEREFKNATMASPVKDSSRPKTTNRVMKRRPSRIAQLMRKVNA